MAGQEEQIAGDGGLWTTVWRKSVEPMETESSSENLDCIFDKVLQNNFGHTVLWIGITVFDLLALDLFSVFLPKRSLHFALLKHHSTYFPFLGVLFVNKQMECPKRNQFFFFSIWKVYQYQTVGFEEFRNFTFLKD